MQRTLKPCTEFVMPKIMSPVPPRNRSHQDGKATPGQHSCAMHACTSNLFCTSLRSQPLVRSFRYRRVQQRDNGLIASTGTFIGVSSLLCSTLNVAEQNDTFTDIKYVVTCMYNTTINDPHHIHMQFPLALFGFMNS